MLNNFKTKNVIVCRSAKSSYAMAALLVGLLLNGCARYEEKPLELEKYYADWQTASSERGLGALAIDGGEFNLNDGIDIKEAELIALLYNSELQIERLRAGVPLATAKKSGKWADPELELGIEKILESVDDPWVLSAGFSITIPLSGSLKAQDKLIASEVNAALAQVLAKEWAVRHELRRLWILWVKHCSIHESLLQHQTALSPLLLIAEKLYEHGQLDDIQLRAMNIVKEENRFEVKESEYAKDRARSAILSLCGLHPDFPLKLNSDLPNIKIDFDLDSLDRLLKHPQLRASISHYQVAEDSVALAIRKQYPDLRIGFGGGTDEGQSRIAMGFGLLPVPLWNKNSKEIATTRAERSLAEGEVKAFLKFITHRLSQAKDHHNHATQRIKLLKNGILPLVEEQGKSFKKHADLGRMDISLMLDYTQRAKAVKMQEMFSFIDKSMAEVEMQSALGPLCEVGTEDAVNK